MTEEWRDAVGWEGYYQVSNMGRVRSVSRIAIDKNGKKYTVHGKILSSSKVFKYNKVMFSANGVKANPRVHRLVAMAFIPNPHNYPQVNHKDENPDNDCVDNLEWCDNKYNMNYGTAPYRRGQKTRRTVNQYDLNGNFLRQWHGIVEAEQQTGAYHSHISACCRGKLRQTGGYIWRYADK